MADTKEPETPADEYVKPDPAKSPRNIILGDIAKQVFIDHAAEVAENAKVPSVDEDGTVSTGEPPAEVVAEPATEEPATTEAEAPAPSLPESAEPELPVVAADPSQEIIDPAKEYEITVDGQKIKVPGKKIIDAGFRTFQKETAADFRLNVATELMEEAQRRSAALPPKGEEPPAAPARKDGEPSDADLAKAMQFGTAEEAAKAIESLRGRGLDQTAINNLVVAQARQATRDEMNFQKALDFVKGEYSDLLSNDHLKRFFFMEENRYRTPKDKGGLGDSRPYMDVYKDIGENMRKSFKLPKAAAPVNPTATAAGRKEAKAAMAPVPRTAASRLAENAAPKAKSAGEIIAGMAATRGQGRLTANRKE